MSQNELSPALLLKLHNKLLIDMNLLRLQQDMRTGQRAYSASVLLSALEDCDEAIETVWLELRRSMRNEVCAEVPDVEAPYHVAQGIPALASAMIAATRHRVRQFFTKTPKANQPLHPSCT